jgi:hypothetical protein
MFGLGGVSFWLFDVVTEKKKWKVKRRYTDFQWLRKMLLKHFPTYIVINYIFRFLQFHAKKLQRKLLDKFKKE